MKFGFVMLSIFDPPSVSLSGLTFALIRGSLDFRHLCRTIGSSLPSNSFVYDVRLYSILIVLPLVKTSLLL